MSDTKSWLCQRLRDLFGFDDVDEMADYLLSFPPSDSPALKQYLQELLGASKEVEDLSNELISRQFGVNEPTSQPRRAQSNKANSKRLNQKERSKVKQSRGPVVGGISVSYESTQSNASQNHQPIGFEERIEQAHLTHGSTPNGGLIANCLHCGYVNIVPASLAKKHSGWGQCRWCHHQLDRTSEYTQSIGFANANELKDRLVQFDNETAKRTKVFDDESDYYSSTAWLSELEKEELQKRDQSRREKMHSRSRDVKISIDLTGKRIVHHRDDDGGLTDARQSYKAKQSAAESSVSDRTPTVGYESMNDDDFLSAPCVKRSSAKTDKGSFKNETLTGHRREVVERMNIKETIEKRTKAKVSDRSVRDLQETLAPWRSDPSTDERTRHKVQREDL